MEPIQAITSKIILSQDLYLDNYEIYSNLKKRYNLFIDNILYLDDFIKDKIVNEIEKIQKQNINTEMSVNKSSNYKSVDEIIECVDCSTGLNTEICYQCMKYGGSRPSCKVSEKRKQQLFQELIITLSVIIINLNMSLLIKNI